MERAAPALLFKVRTCFLCVVFLSYLTCTILMVLVSLLKIKELWKGRAAPVTAD